MYNKWFQDYEAEKKLENETPVEETNDETEKEEENAVRNWAWEPEQSDSENEDENGLSMRFIMNRLVNMECIWYSTFVSTFPKQKPNFSSIHFTSTNAAFSILRQRGTF